MTRTLTKFLERNRPKCSLTLIFFRIEIIFELKTKIPLDAYFLWAQNFYGDDDVLDPKFRELDNKYS